MEEEYPEIIKKKISVLPNFPKELVEELIKVWSTVRGRRKRKIQEKIDKLVDRAYSRHTIDNKNPILPYPSESESRGHIQIGFVCAGDQVLYPYYLTRVNLTENIFGVGRAGSGKTTFLIFFIEQLEKAGIGYTVIDWKNDFTFLTQKHDNVNLLKWHHIAYNPWTNIPPGMDRKLWWFIVLDIIAHSTGLYVATPSHVLEALEEIYHSNNGRINTRDLYQYLKSQNETRKREEYNSTALNRLFLLNELLDPVINVDYGFDIEELFKTKCVLQMAPLHQAVSSFLFNALVLWEYHRRLYKNIRADWQSAPIEFFLSNFHILLMDEAHMTQYGGQEHKDATIFSPPPLSAFFSQSRELGLATCAFTQFPDMVMSAFKKNAGTMIIGNVVEANIRADLAASLGLDKEDEKLLGETDKGFWVVNVAGRTKKPFLMKTPMVVKPIVAEQEVIDSKFLSKLKMRKQEMEARMFLEATGKEESKPDSGIPIIPDNAWRVLLNVFESPLQYQKKRAKQLGFSGRKITSVRDYLIEKNLIRVESFQVNDYRKTFYVLTKNALENLKKLRGGGEEDRKRIGFHEFLSSSSAGFEHRFFQLYLKMQHEELGWKTKIEPKLPNGRMPDLYAKLDGKTKIIELEFSTTDLENKISVLQYCDELVLLFKEASHVLFAKSKLEKMKDIPKEKIAIGLANDYTKLLTEIMRNSITKPEKAQKGTEIEGLRPKDILNWKPDGKGVENN